MPGPVARQRGCDAESDVVRRVSEADTQQMASYHTMIMMEQPVMGGHLGAAESHSNKCNKMRGQPPIGVAGLILRKASSSGQPPKSGSTISESGQTKGYP